MPSLITSAVNGEGAARNAVNLQTNFADKEGGGGQKIPKLCGLHTWKPPEGNDDEILGGCAVEVMLEHH